MWEVLYGAIALTITPDPNLAATVISFLNDVKSGTVI